MVKRNEKEKRLKEQKKIVKELKEQKVEVEKDKKYLAKQIKNIKKTSEDLNKKGLSVGEIIAIILGVGVVGGGVYALSKYRSPVNGVTYMKGNNHNDGGDFTDEYIYGEYEEDGVVFGKKNKFNPLFKR